MPSMTAWYPVSSNLTPFTPGHRTLVANVEGRALNWTSPGPTDSEIVIERSTFARNGKGDGFTHNIYVGRIKRLTVRAVDSHHARIGHNLKSRARKSTCRRAAWRSSSATSSNKAPGPTMPPCSPTAPRAWPGRSTSST